MSTNDLLITKLQFKDFVTLEEHLVYASGDALYYDGFPFAPLNSGLNNSNDIMILNLPLASGATSQKFYFPVGYEPTTTPKVLFSVFGESQQDLIVTQLSESNVDYFRLEFAHPIPNDQYHLQAFILKQDDYISFEGTNFELNPQRTARTVYVDTIYGHDFGSFSGRRQNPNLPFLSFEQAYANAWSGDTIHFYQGNYSGIIIDRDLTLRFAENAVIEYTPISVSANRSVTFENLQINHKSGSFAGITLASTAKAFFKGENLIKVGGTSSINGGQVTVYGNLYYDKPILSKYINLKVGDFTGAFVDSSFRTGFNFSGYNGRNVYSNISDAITASPQGSLIKVSKGNYGGFHVNKALKFSFDNEARVTGQISILASTDAYFKNLQTLISSPNSGAMSLGLDSNVYFEEENYLTTNGGNSITGAGSLYFRGNAYYNNLISQSLRTENGFNFVVSSGASFDTFSGKNNTIEFDNIQSASNFATGYQDIRVRRGDYKGFTVVNKTNLNFLFEEDAKVNSSILISGTAKRTFFNDLKFDSISDTGVLASIILDPNTTGTLRGDTSIRIPNVYSRYFILNNGSQYTLNDGYALLGYSGKGFTHGATGTTPTISGWYARPLGIGTGYFFQSVTGDVTGEYRSISGAFRGSYNLDSNMILKYYSGTATGNITGYSTVGIVGNVTGTWYSGVTNTFVNGITGNGILGFASNGTFFVDPTPFFEGQFNQLGFSGYYFSGQYGQFTGNFYRENVTGYWTTGHNSIPNTYFTSSTPHILFITGYYVSGRSGFYVSGLTPNGPISGVTASGATFFPRYSVSGNGSIDYGNSIYNLPPFEGVLNLRGDLNGLKSGAPIFEPFGIIF